jgi:hypothetical protein
MNKTHRSFLRVAMSLKFAVALCMLIGFGTAFGQNICRIGSVEYATLTDAVAAVPTDCK